MNYYGINTSKQELQHYGILGMKWGVRRYQNPDGSLTQAGKRRYDVGGSIKKAASGTAKAAESKVHAAQKASYESKRRSEQSRSTGIMPWNHTAARKNKYDSYRRTAKDRLEFYGSKAVAKDALERETKHRRFMENVKQVGRDAGMIAAGGVLASAMGSFAPMAAVGAGLVASHIRHNLRLSGIDEAARIGKLYIDDMKVNDDKVKASDEYRNY